VKLIEFFEDKDHLISVMELIKGGNLVDAIIQEEVFDEKDVHRVMAPIFDAVILCHSKSENRICNGLNIDNLLLSDKKL
jgi:serine/threonine protein kinase